MLPCLTRGDNAPSYRNHNHRELVSEARGSAPTLNLMAEALPAGNTATEMVALSKWQALGSRDNERRLEPAGPFSELPSLGLTRARHVVMSGQQRRSLLARRTDCADRLCCAAGDRPTTGLRPAYDGPTTGRPRRPTTAGTGRD
jgi:hypothetical protein